MDNRSIDSARVQNFDPERWDSLASKDQLASLPLSPEESQRWIQIRIEEYTRYSNALRAAYNRVSPVHRHLLPDVLMEIFCADTPPVTVGAQHHECLPDMAASHYQHSRILGGSPCSFYRSLGSPVQGLKRLQTFLMRSRPKPLRFLDTTFTSTTQSNFTSTLMPHLNRVTLLDIAVPAVA
ncbi:hypothetical protein C8Q74DRAFT_208986 [Fomes fomentarius]|nr:hypothetical protein C8Q74DRAFT_208986 [Fomes fomentarius]